MKQIIARDHLGKVIFRRKEFKCKCENCKKGRGYCAVDKELLDVLIDVRIHFDKPVKLNSVCRCKDYNEFIGGAENSFHIFAQAADIEVVGVASWKVAKYLDDRYPIKYGIGLHKNFVHVDIGTRRWRKKYY